MRQSKITHGLNRTESGRLEGINAQHAYPYGATNGDNQSVARGQEAIARGQEKLLQANQRVVATNLHTPTPDTPAMQISIGTPVGIPPHVGGGPVNQNIVPTINPPIL